MTHGWPHMPFDAWLTGLLQYLVGIVFVFFLGRLAHELTHVLVANALGLEVTRIDIRVFSGHVEYRVDETTPRWKPRAVNAAPQIVGVVTLPVLAYVVLTADALLVFVALVLWSAYAILGSASDLSLEAALGDGHLWHPTKAEQLALVSLGLLFAGFIVGLIDPSTPYFGPFITEMQFGLAISAGGVLVMSVREFQPGQAA